MAHPSRNLLLITTCLAGGMGVGGWLYSVRSAPPRRAPGTPPPFVKTLVVRAEDVTETYVGYGTARADSIARLSADVASTVLERVGDVREGVRVTAGQPLIRLDDRAYRHALDQALALADADAASIDELDIERDTIGRIVATAQQEYRVATAEFERVQDLFERDLAAEKEMNVATRARQRARRLLEGYQRERAQLAPRRTRVECSRRGRLAAVERTRLDIERCVIVAPIDGVIQTLSVDVGDRVSQGSAVARVVDARRIEIPVQLPGALYARVKPGMACRVDSERSPDSIWSGRVARVAPTIDEQTRTFAVYLAVDNREPSHRLVPGMFVRARIEGMTVRDALTVPRGAIRDGYVWVVQDGVARRRSVVVDRNVVERAVVHGALAAGDRVILTSLNGLTDGTPVRVSEDASVRNADPPDARSASSHSAIEAPAERNELRAP